MKPTEIRNWLNKAVKDRCQYLLIMEDIVNHDISPVYVKQAEDIKQVIKIYNARSMKRVWEVYSMALPIDDQLAEDRAWHE